MQTFLNKSAVTGRIVSNKYAVTHPHTTFRERIIKRTPTSAARYAVLKKLLSR